MRDEEWIKTIEDGRKVKFIYQELPDDGAFITAQIERLNASDPGVAFTLNDTRLQLQSPVVTRPDDVDELLDRTTRFVPPPTAT